MAMRALLALSLFASAPLLFGGSLMAQTASQTVVADVLAHSIKRGEVLSERDFVSEELPAARARGFLPMREAAGLEARRWLRSGLPVREGDLIEPRAVRRGESVTIRLRTGALTISGPGRALGDAAVGEAVRVFSESTKQTLDAFVEGAGVVRISIP